MKDADPAAYAAVAYLFCLPAVLFASSWIGGGPMPLLYSPPEGGVITTALVDVALLLAFTVQSLG